MKTQTIEVDERTAESLKVRARERGVSVAELVADLVTLDSQSIAADSSEIAELDRRWRAVENGRAIVPDAQVVRWLRTWGTPAFRPWPGDES
jgi:predicted transcriptional regulator